MYDFYYGPEAEQFTFYRIPKVLFEADGVRDISTDAKLLYGLMLDRMQLSARNNWMDENGRIYIYYTVNQIMRNLGCGNKKVAKLLDELETEAKLIERVRIGFNKPNRIYVKNFLSVVSKGHDHTCQKDTTGSVEMTSLEVSKGHTNNTDINNTEFSDNNLIVSEEERCDGMDEYNAYERIIKENLDYDTFIQDRHYDRRDIDEIIALMTDVMISHKGTIRVSGEDKPIEVVKSRFMKLDSTHIQYVLDVMKDNPVKVRNIKAYLLASLYNAPVTISNYYTALVNHDMYGDLYG